MSLASETQTRCQHRSLEHGGARNCAHCPWGLPLCALPPQCRVCFSSVPRHELVPTPSTTKMSTQAAASVQQPALKKATPAEPGPTPKRPGAAPGAALSGAGPASAVGGEVLAKKAAVIHPKPRAAPVPQPAVKHEEAVPAQKTAPKSEEAVPVQMPTVKKASPTPAVHRSGSGGNLSRADSVHAVIT